MPGIKSVWNEYFDAAGRSLTGKSPPVSVNKMRGPSSGQPSKIGLHALELIDHVYFGGGVRFVEHISELPSFSSAEVAAESLIPDENMPSDHYPVHVRLELPRSATSLSCFGRKGDTALCLIS